MMIRRIPVQERIVRMRIRYDITQEQLGELLGVTGQSVSNWESGRCDPDLFHFVVLIRMGALALIQPDLSRLRKSLP